MKINLLIIGLTFLTLPLAFGQEANSTDKVYQAKVKFFNEKLQLSQEESKNFWPVYNDYYNRKNLLSSERTNIIKYYNNNQQNLSEAEISESLSRYIEIQKEEVKLTETYNEKFKQILSDEKVLMIYITEIQFRQFLLTRLRANNIRN